MSTAAQKPALSALLTSETQTFLADGWPGEVFSAHNGPSALPEFLRCEALTSYEHLVAVNTGRVAFTNGQKSPYMVPAEPKSTRYLPDMGLTVLFEDLTTSIPGAEPFVRQLEIDLGIGYGAASMSAWVSPGDNGVACHYDPYDTFSIHLAGTKTWELASVDELSFPTVTQYSPGSAPDPDLYAQMADGFPHWQDVAFQSVEMHPGSVLYVPRGTWHRTRATSPTLAVTVVLKPANTIDLLLPQLRSLLLQDPAWREPLYGAWGDNQGPSCAAKVDSLLNRLPDIIKSLDGAHLIRSGLTPEQRLQQLNEVSRFQRKPQLHVPPNQATDIAPEQAQWISMVEVDDSGTETFFNRIEVPRMLVEVIEKIGQTSAPITAATLSRQFPDVSVDYHLRLLELAARAGLVEVLDFPALVGTDTDS